MHKFFLISLFVLLAGCRVPPGGRMLAIKDADPQQWRRTALTVDIDDTLARRDLSVYLRIDGTFEGGRLPLTIRTQAPGGGWTQDTITTDLARHTGQSFGEITLPWRKGVVFPRNGTYIINITGGPVCGIRAVGIVENGQE